LLSKSKAALFYAGASKTQEKFLKRAAADAGLYNLKHYVGEMVWGGFIFCFFALCKWIFFRYNLREGFSAHVKRKKNKTNWRNCDENDEKNDRVSIGFDYVLGVSCACDGGGYDDTCWRTFGCVD
jgi:hypothetical protein